MPVSKLLLCLVLTGGILGFFAFAPLSSAASPHPIPALIRGTSDCNGAVWYAGTEIYHTSFGCNYDEPLTLEPYVSSTNPAGFLTQVGWSTSTDWPLEGCVLSPSYVVVTPGNYGTGWSEGQGYNGAGCGGDNTVNSYYGYAYSTGVGTCNIINCEYGVGGIDHLAYD